MKKIAVAAALFFACSLLFAADTACPPKWGYGTNNGPDRWGQMETAWEKCDGGKRQSPVDLGTSTHDSALPALAFNYAATPIVVQNTGRSIKVLSLGTNRVQFGEIGTLKEFHFHVMAEHTVNNTRPAAELHLVHEKENKKLIVVGVFIDQTDRENAALKQLLESRPTDECVSKRPRTLFNPAGLLPTVRDKFLNYPGSLTTPACDEDVEWIVLRDHIQATADQINALKAGSENYRQPTALLGGRTVKRNF